MTIEEIGKILAKYEIINLRKMKTLLALLLLIPSLSLSTEDLGGKILNCDIEFRGEDDWNYRGYIFDSKFHRGEEEQE